MKSWPGHPIIYEINTWVWLDELRRRERRALTLADVPAVTWDSIASFHVDAVWLMGVWERSAESTRIARSLPALQAEYRRAVPDFAPQDIVGSPYSIRRYHVDPNFGGDDALQVARRELAERGIRLLLDFVPNHVAPDHPWVQSHPEYFMQASDEELRREPNKFFRTDGQVFAHGRDPFFDPWTDTAQLNAFSPHLRWAVEDTLGSIAERCDGVRCDMAMLLVNRIFQQTWQDRVGDLPKLEFWTQVIGAVRQEHPDFLFIAEAYWDMEWELQKQGFDYCYDKRLYNRLVNETADTVRRHLQAELPYQEKLIRFIENHDEPRATATFEPKSYRALALTVVTLPGALLLHEGQLEGRQVKLPVQLGRRPDELPDVDLHAFYRKLIGSSVDPVIRQGQWALCERTGWPDNRTFLNLVAWCWRHEQNRYLIVVNLSRRDSQARIQLPWADLAGHSWLLEEVLTRSTSGRNRVVRYERQGDELLSPGLYVDLKPWGYHFFAFESAGPDSTR